MNRSAGSTTAFVKSCSTDGPDDTRALGRALAALLTVGDVVILTGDLGAGKTCLTQGVGAGLGIDERITSPTFTLANRYRGSADDALVLHHLDVYRLESVAETLDLDLPDLVDTGVTVIEWGEQILEVLNTDHLRIALTYLPPSGEPGLPPGGEPDCELDEFASDDRRRLRFDGVGESWVKRGPAVEAALAPWMGDRP